jgi:hypothetical protein
MILKCLPYKPILVCLNTNGHPVVTLIEMATTKSIGDKTKRKKSEISISNALIIQSDKSILNY